MAVIRRADAGLHFKDAVVLDLGDLARQGEAVKADAQARARETLSQAAAERQKLIAGAAEEGRRAGFKEGREKGLAEGRAEGRDAAMKEFKPRFEQLEKGWTAALERFDTDRRRVLLDARQDVLTLALLVATKILKRRIETDPTVVVDQVAAVLEILAKPTRLTLRVHPDDRAILENALPTLTAKYTAAEHVEITSDETLPRGSCAALTAGGGAIDATIGTQLDRIIDTLLPARPVDGISGPYLEKSS